MPAPKSKGGRPAAPEFHEGPKSATRFMKAIKTVMGVSKERILELEKQSKKSRD